MASREEALTDIVDIAKRHKLSSDEIAKALQHGVTENQTNRTSGIVAKVLAFLGGILVLAGIALFIGMQWEEFNSATRVLMTLGVGFAIYLFALVTMTDKRFAKLTTPMLLISGLLQPTGILVMLDEYSRGGKPEHGLLFMCVVMFSQQFLTFLAKKEYSSLLFLSLFFGAAGFGTLCDILEIDFELTSLALGTCLICLSYVIDKTIHKAITPFWYFAASVFFLFGIFELLEGSVLEILFFGIAAGVMYLGVVVRSRTLLFISVLAIMSFTGYYFQGVLFNAFGLMIMGALLIGLSMIAMRLNRKYIQN